MTREQAIQASYRTTLHYGCCARKVGPRGGVKVDIVEYRVSGQYKTWKRNPQAFRLPVKYGMYSSGAVTESNADLFHLATDCSLDHTCYVPSCGQVLRKSDGTAWQHAHSLTYGERKTLDSLPEGYLVLVPGDTVDAAIMARQERAAKLAGFASVADALAACADAGVGVLA